MSTRRTTEFLDGNKARYTVISHSPAYSAQEVAASAHIPGKCLAKTVVVDIDGKLALAVVPADHTVDMSLLRAAAAAGYAGLADEADFARRFEGCQVGAMPPFGNLFGMDTFVDRNLARAEFIAFNAGTHADLIAMKFNDFRRLAHPHLVHISAPADVPAGSHS